MVVGDTFSMFKKVQLRTIRGAVVEDVRTVFELKNDATVYIPAFYPTL